MKSSYPILLLASAGLVFAACKGGGQSTTGTGGSGGGQGGGGAAPIDPAKVAYPDLAALFNHGVAGTCALNQGVCHSERDYPSLGTAKDLLATIGAPCQLGAQDPASTLPQCEIPGDRLSIGGSDVEILGVTIAPDAPYPPDKVELRLASAPASLDPTGARIHRLAPKGGADELSRALDGVALTAGADALHVVLALGAATDTTLADFLDVRAWRGDRVRMGDPNNDGVAHASPKPWAEITPGDPSRSFFYQRLVTDAYGPTMPIIQRTWGAAATRAVWCWIRGMPAGATPDTMGIHDTIDYDACPIDPDAPDPGEAGGWPAVHTLMQSKCSSTPCHSKNTQSAGLDLTADAATFAKYVVNVEASQAPGTLRVAPGQPAASYLLCKVDPKCTAKEMGTAIMPLNGTELSEAEIKTISDWILNGAPTQ